MFDDKQKSTHILIKHVSLSYLTQGAIIRLIILLLLLDHLRVKIIQLNFTCILSVYRSLVDHSLTYRRRKETLTCKFE